MIGVYTFFKSATLLSSYYDRKLKSHLDEQVLKEVVEAADRALTINEYISFAYLLKGQAYAELEEPKQALTSYNRALEINPVNDTVYFLKSVVHRDLKNYQQALAEINRALELNPEFSCVLCTAGFNLQKFKTV